MNELLTKSVTQMTKEERDILRNELIQQDMSELKTQLEEEQNARKKLEETVDLYGNDIEKAKNDIAETKNFINVLGFAVNSYKYKILCGKAKGRVYKLLNADETGVDFTVWSHYFFKKIYCDIANHFNVSKCENIHVDDFEDACEIADNWYPTDYYIKVKIEEMKLKAQNGLLKQERILALNMYLKNTDNGSYNPFK